MRLASANLAKKSEDDKSDRLFDIPDKGPEAKLGFVEVDLSQRRQEGFHAVVVDKGDDGRSERGPCVRAEMRLAVMAAAALHLAEGCEAPAEVGLKRLENVLVMRLVVCYEY